VDPVTWCPPTFVGNSGIERSNGHRGFALSFFEPILFLFSSRPEVFVAADNRGANRFGHQAAAASVRRSMRVKRSGKSSIRGSRRWLAVRSDQKGPAQ
jgi:hypothetical protein